MMPVLVIRKVQVLPGRKSSHWRLHWTSDLVLRHRSDDVLGGLVTCLGVFSGVVDGEQAAQFLRSGRVLWVGPVGGLHRKPSAPRGLRQEFLLSVDVEDQLA